MEPMNLLSVSEFLLLGFSSQPRMQLLLFAVFLAIYLAILFENSLIFVLIKIDSHLHMPMYFFLANLSFLDISYTTTTVPQMLLHLLSKKKNISYVGCIIQMYIFLSLGITECILYAVMMVASSWVGGFFFAMVHTGVTMRLPYCGLNEINHFFCEVPAILKLACADTRVTKVVVFVMGVILLMTPVFLILVSYVFIMVASLRISSAEGGLKAFSICTAHFTMVTLFYGAAMFMYMRPASSYSPERDKYFSFFYNVVSALLNPLIYSLRNKDVKGALVKLMGLLGSFPSFRRGEVEQGGAGTQDSWYLLVMEQF
uniref:G-protein coupled receptors family 1 profile domain-containing protein n=1 Tax=Chelonoidis abingdonii TaxID=106734 RepID=A0A8C0G118_CHEAB